MARHQSVLDLDEFFGEDRPIFVKWEDKTHELTHPNSLGPKQLAQFEKLSAKADSMMKDTGDELTDDQAELLETFITDLVGMIGPTLKPASMPFFAKVKIIDFYNREVGYEDKVDDAGKAGG